MAVEDVQDPSEQRPAAAAAAGLEPPRFAIGPGDAAAPSAETAAARRRSSRFSASSGHPSDDSIQDSESPLRNARRRITGRASADSDGRVPLQGFLNRSSTAIRSPDHAAALIGILQLAGAHPDGIAGALGHGNRTRWLTLNLGRIFSGHGPCYKFKRVRPAILLKHFSRARTFAKGYYRRDHSNEQSGAGHEDIPQWVRHFFPLLDAEQYQATRNARTAAARDESRTVVRSLVGAQAHLGYQGDHPAELRTETSRNDGAPEMRQRTVGDVTAERINIPNGNAGTNHLIEGRDDTAHRAPAPSRVTLNGTQHRNVHLSGEGFTVGFNDPSTRFQHIVGMYDSMSLLSGTIADMIAAPPQLPPRLPIDIVRNYFETDNLRTAATTSDEGRAFASRAMNLFSNELGAIERAVEEGTRNRDGHGGNGGRMANNDENNVSGGIEEAHANGVVDNGNGDPGSNTDNA